MYNQERFEKLKEAFSGTACTEFEGLEFHTLHFRSEAADVLPGCGEYQCRKHRVRFGKNDTFINDVGSIGDVINAKDASIEENREFDYRLIKPKDGKQVSRLIFLFHGFNEKNWDKYLGWGEAICRGTGSAVVFFPIAFHMQRAPSPWSDPREMFRLSEYRKKRYPNVINSSLSNVAISMRLHSMPQRYIWSGLQTYYDIIKLIESYRGGSAGLIRSDFSFNIFAYSIGGFLAEILKLTNHMGYFSDTKVFLFCGGPVFNRFLPVSKFILDSEANLALYSCLVEHFESFLKKEARLRHYIEEGHPEGKVLHAMLNYQHLRDFREDLFRKYADDFHALSLKGDRIIPSYEVMNTLKGADGDIGIDVEILDFDHEYSHENPFPLKGVDSERVNGSFTEVFERVSRFLKDFET